MKNQLIKIERDVTLTKSLNEDGEFEGYASVFGSEDHHGDTVVRGAFKKGLSKLVKEKRKVKMLWHHDRLQPIGVYKEVDEDDKGLYFRGKLTLGVQRADETRLLMLDEAVDAVSIGGYVVKEKWDNKTLKRELIEIELREISPVTFPALDGARINSVKSLSDNADLSEVEAILRDAGGFSLKDSKKIISIIKSSSSHRDVDGRTAKLINEAIQNLKG